MNLSTEDNNDLQQLLLNKNNQLRQEIKSLKENNASLLEMFNQQGKAYQKQIQELETELITLKCNYASKCLDYDQIELENKSLKKFNDSRARTRTRSVSDDATESLSDDIQSPKYTSKIQIIQHLQQTNLQQDRNLVKSFKSMFNSSDSQNQTLIKLIMETSPISNYGILYQEELQKMRDEVKLKTGEKIIWEQEVISLFQKRKINNLKIKKQIESYIRNFIPEIFRGKLWKFVIENKLKIKKTLFKNLENRVNLNEGVREELKTIIHYDLIRTFNLINSYNNADKLKDDLRIILLSFSLYRPDIGYVQGMTYIAFMFLIRMDIYNTFQCFANLILKSEILRTFFSFNSYKIQAYFNTFEYFFEQKIPEVHKHLNDYCIPPQSYLVELIYTLFSRAFNLVIASKIWDLVLVFGDVAILRIVIAIFSVVQSDLISLDYEDSMLFIRSCTSQLNEGDLWKAYERQRVNEKDLVKILEIELDKIKLQEIEKPK